MPLAAASLVWPQCQHSLSAQDRRELLISVIDSALAPTEGGIDDDIMMEGSGSDL
jgi:hypothetical protein